MLFGWVFGLVGGCVGVWVCGYMYTHCHIPSHLQIFCKISKLFHTIRLNLNTLKVFIGISSVYWYIGWVGRWLGGSVGRWVHGSVGLWVHVHRLPHPLPHPHFHNIFHRIFRKIFLKISPPTPPPS